MRCPNCGGETGENVKFCQFCGSQITADMKKEMDRLNREGCPRCKSTNVHFEREIEGQLRNERGSRVMRSTVGICDDCGFTWDADGNKSHVNFSHTNPDYHEPIYQNTPAPKKRRTWLWVLGWIFIFPVPLTIILVRKQTRLPMALKVVFIVFAWLLYLGALAEDDKPVVHEQTRSTIEYVNSGNEEGAKGEHITYGSDHEGEGKKVTNSDKAKYLKKSADDIENEEGTEKMINYKSTAIKK